MKKFLTLALALITLVLMATEVMAQTRRKPVCLPSPSGMVAWWPLDGLDPTTGEYVDLVGGDSNGTRIGNPSQLLNQYIGDSLQAGIGKYVRVIDAPNLNFGQGSFSIDAWVKFTPGTQTEPIVFKLASTSGNSGGYFLSIVKGVEREASWALYSPWGSGWGGEVRALLKRSPLEQLRRAWCGPKK